MKVEEQKKAIALRKQGVAMGEIANMLGVAKSSISLWVRDVHLTKSQLSVLAGNSHSFQVVEKRRQARLHNSQVRKDIMREQAFIEARILINNPLWCVGVALYWGEGGKTQGTTRISNSDPKVIKIMMSFFKEICKIPEAKFRGHVHTFAHGNIEATEKYWSDVSGINRSQFFKTYTKNSSASLEKRHTLPNGTIQIYIHDSNFFIKMMAWVDYLKDVKNYD